MPPVCLFVSLTIRKNCVAERIARAANDGNGPLDLMRFDLSGVRGRLTNNLIRTCRLSKASLRSPLRLIDQRHDLLICG
jgi:hypothetical protein